MTRRGLLWTMAALLGILVTAAITWSVSRLAGQRIGLSAAPLSAIRGLAPADTGERRTRPALHHVRPPRPAPAQRTTTSAPPATAATTTMTTTPLPTGTAPVTTSTAATASSAAGSTSPRQPTAGPRPGGVRPDDSGGRSGGGAGRDD